MPLCCILKACISSMERTASCLLPLLQRAAQPKTGNIGDKFVPETCTALIWWIYSWNASSLTGLNHQVCHSSTSKNLRSTFTVYLYSQLWKDSSIIFWPILKWILWRWSHPVCVYSHKTTLLNPAAPLDIDHIYDFLVIVFFFLSLQLNQHRPLIFRTLFKSVGSSDNLATAGIPSQVVTGLPVFLWTSFPGVGEKVNNSPGDSRLSCSNYSLSFCKCRHTQKYSSQWLCDVCMINNCYSEDPEDGHSHVLCFV